MYVLALSAHRWHGSARRAARHWSRRRRRWRRRAARSGWSRRRSRASWSGGGAALKRGHEHRILLHKLLNHLTNLHLLCQVGVDLLLVRDLELGEPVVNDDLVRGDELR